MLIFGNDEGPTASGGGGGCEFAQFESTATGTRMELTTARRLTLPKRLDENLLHFKAHLLALFSRLVSMAEAGTQSGPY